MNMKKSALAAAMLLSLGTTAAQAASIDLTTMAFYDAAGAPGFFGGGLNTSVVTTVSFDATVGGKANSGPTPFFGTPWTANQAMYSEVSGNWSGNTASGAFNYDYTLAAGQVAVGIDFTWGASTGIMVLQIFDCTDGVTCAPITFDPAHGAAGTTPASHNVPGTAMANGPFANQHATFAGVSAVPVPAAVWLFGSGLVGLAGIARRRKAA